MRSLFKKYHKCKEVDLCMDNDVLDISKDGAKMGKQLRPAPSPSLRDRYLAFSEFLFRLADGNGEDKAYVISSFEVTNIPG